jgi:hypothetical protein|tara:strand:+ start:63 stop:335 length:273 start_codon:yes stop_codon:yes gene_type:complete
MISFSNQRATLTTGLASLTDTIDDTPPICDVSIDPNITIEKTRTFVSVKWHSTVVAEFDCFETDTNIAMARAEGFAVGMSRGLECHASAG